MDARPTSRLPELSVANGSSGLIRLGDLAHIAEAAGVTAISLDLSSSWARWLVSRQALPAVRVASVWLGQPWKRDRPAPALQYDRFAMSHRLNAATLAIDLGGPDGRIASPAFLIPWVAQTRRRVSRDCRLLVAIRGRHLVGGRPHLAELTALRHLVEEWDLGIALDLAYTVDPTWEAEAAVFRLGNHLRLLRVPTSALDRFAIGKDRVISRAVAAAIDQGMPPEIALVPTVPLIQVASRRAKLTNVDRAVEAIENRVASMKAQRAQFLDQGLWPNLRG